MRYNLIKLRQDGSTELGNFDFATIEQAQREADRKNRALSDLGVTKFRWVPIEAKP